MIVTALLSYCVIEHVYSYFKQKYLEKSAGRKAGVEWKSEVMVDVKPQVDAEVRLKFDPPVCRQRYSAVKEVLISPKWYGKVKKLVEYGCADLHLFIYLKNLIGLEEILFVDVDAEIVQRSAERTSPLTADYLNRRGAPLNVKLLQGSIDAPDIGLLFVDAVICIEIIEHLYPDTLDAFPHNIFGFIQPSLVVFTTPNADFNVLFPQFPGRRHYDHKFEWTRRQFQDWSYNITARYPHYTVHFEGIGAGPKGTEHLGFCSQMAIFTKVESHECDDTSRNELIQQALKTHLSSISVEESCDTSSEDECVFCQVDISSYISYGVCTYKSRNKYNSDSNKCEHTGFSYKTLREVEYPFEIDNRTQEEIIRDEIEWRLNQMVAYRNLTNDEVLEVPLHDLTYNKDGHFITELELRNILEKSGYKIVEQDRCGAVVPYVFYKKVLEMSECSSETSDDDQFSVDVNYENEKEWRNEGKVDADTEVWDEACSNNSSSVHTKTDGTELWDETTSNDVSTARSEVSESGALSTATRTELSESSLYRTCLEDVSANSADVEVLFGCDVHMSTSSANVSLEAPEVALDPDKGSSKVKPAGFKSESYIFKRKRKCKANEARVVPEIVLLAPPEVENPPIVENGDLANNNRDREGNNYQAAEHLEQADDNAVPREQNLDEHNENHIIADVDLEEHLELNEDEDALENLEDASREVLYDPNSEMALPDSLFHMERYSTALQDIDIVDDLAVIEFPAWLLQILQEDEEDEDDDDDELENGLMIMGQGDGLGVHDSDIELLRLVERPYSANSDVQDNVDGGSATVSALSSSTDVQFQDALESLEDTPTEDDTH